MISRLHRGEKRLAVVGKDDGHLGRGGGARGQGVEPGDVEVDPLGEAFDPEYHQAITVQEAADCAPGTVTTVVQKGYLLNDRLIRPAMVIVAQ